jgi:hypothetical protein
MVMNKESFIVDDAVNRIAVMLSIKEYNRMCLALEELEDIKAYDAAKAKNEETIPLIEAINLRNQNKTSY